MQCSWNAHALWKIVPSLGAEDTKRWRKGSKFPLARYEAWHLCWCKTRSAKKKKKKWQIDSKRSFEYPHKYVIGIQKKGKVKVLQQTYRTATRTQRDGAHWGKGSWRNGGCPNQTAPLFPLLLYSFPHSPLPETSGAFQISAWFTFPSSKACLSQPKKAGIGLCCRDSRGFLVWISTIFSNFYICRFPNFAVDWWLWCLSFLLSKKIKSC
jgi:hypothetical protein